MLHLRDGVLTYVPEPLTVRKLVVPHSQREMMLTHAHNAPCTGHHGAKVTYETLKQVAYWPGMQQEVARKGMTYPWLELQIDWVGSLPRSTRGNK